MQLDTTHRDLGRVPVRGLRLWARDADEAVWMEDTLRQDSFKVHARTQSVILLWTDHSDFPRLHRRPWPRWDELRPLLWPAVRWARHQTGAKGPLCTTMLARLLPGEHIPAHTDSAHFFGVARRFHVPLLTHERVEFRVDGERIAMPASHLVEIDNRRHHAVFNGSDTPRVHLIFDILDQDPTP